MAIKPIKAPSQDDREFWKDLNEWKKLTDEIAKKADEEKQLRLKLAAHFDNVREGTNKMELGYGKVLELQHRINRKIDEAELDAGLVSKTLPIDVCNELFTYKPNLSVAKWKDLDDKTRKLFASVITEEAGTPGLKIVTPKR